MKTIIPFFVLISLLTTPAFGLVEGDVDHDGIVDLKDSILSLQTSTGIVPDSPVFADSDVNNDNRVGTAEAIFGIRMAVFHPDTVIWDETSVRKVLQTFAWGGFPADSQIETWAAMSPRTAIDEIMSFDPFNQKLSPSDFDNLHTSSDGQLENLADFWASDSPDNYQPESRRNYYDKKGWSGPRYSWFMAIRSRGLNSFRNRIGFWESNYHMAANQGAGIYPFPIIRHFDNIMEAHEQGLPYQQVMAKAALNAAVAYQYGHNHNVFIDGEFRGNDDFAREFHQLFFCNLGMYDHDYHESVSIENTAKALTGIRANYYPSEEGGPDVEVYFAADVHHTNPLEILYTSIPGPTAKEKIENLAEISIVHPETMQNLPVMIVETLADNNLSDDGKDIIRQMWADLPPEKKTLLEFLKRYAISEQFHSADRIKYHTSFDRNLFIHNQMQISNHELYDRLNRVEDLLYDDSVIPFYPLHNVFGHQTSAEAFNSQTIFKNTYNLSTESYWYFYDISDSDEYTKDWQTVIPTNQYNVYQVRDVAEWLWKRFVADGLKNYGSLEKAHIYTLLATGHDLGYYMHDNLPGSPDPTTIYYAEELESSASPQGVAVINAGNAFIDLASTDSDIHMNANRFVQLAIAFIAATPYTFLEEGR